jgi:hypothetical protein
VSADEAKTSNSPTAAVRSRLEVIQLAATIGIALLGGWLSFEQHQIRKALDQQRQEHDERIAITTQSTELLKRAKDYLKELKLEEEKNDRVLISLLAIEKNIRMSLTGEIRESGVREQVDLLPLHLALLAHDSESLAHIGGSEQDLERWIPIAKASGDVEVRKAAIDALKKIGELSSNAVVVEECVDAIADLTQRWNNAELRAAGADAMRQIAEIHSKGEIDDSERLNAKILDTLRELEGTNTLAQVSTEDLAPGTADEVVESATRGQEKEQRDAIRTLREQYQLRAEVPPSAEALATLIEELNSSDATSRRLARSKISDYADEAVGPLVDALRRAPSNYQLRVGAVTALMLMPQPLQLNRSQIDVIVPLLGDPDKAVRTNAAQFLGQMTHPETVAQTNEALTAIATNYENFSNANYIYNSVIVLVDWLRWNDYVQSSDEMESSISDSLRSVREALEQDKRNWSSTRARIDEGLELIET